MSSNEWRRCRLGDVLQLQRGFDLPERLREDGDVPVVASSGITGFHSTPKVSGPGVVTGRYGSIGQVFYINRSYWPLNTTLWVKDFKGSDPRFVYYWLQIVDFESVSAKSAVPGINRNDLHGFDALVPLPEEQRRIAGILISLDDKLEQSGRLTERLMSFVDALFRSRFLRGETRPRRRLAEIASQHKKSVQPNERPDELFEHFSIPAFDDGQVPALELGSTILSGKTLLPAEDVVLLSKLNPGTRRIWWPRPTGAGVPVCSSEFVALVPSREPATFLYAALRNDAVLYDELLSQATGTTGSRQRVKPHDVLACSVVAPRSDEVAAFDSAVRPIFELAASLDRESRHLSAIRDKLLPKHVSGAIRVPDSYDPDDALGTVAAAAGVAVP
jgi:type I restriction enzyme S subunit